VPCFPKNRKVMNRERKESVLPRPGGEQEDAIKTRGSRRRVRRKRGAYKHKETKKKNQEGDEHLQKVGGKRGKLSSKRSFREKTPRNRVKGKKQTK